MWLAWRLPKKLVYWCLQRAWAFATDKNYSDTVIHEVTMQTVIKRWEKESKIWTH